MTESDLNYPQAWFKPPPPLSGQCMPQLLQIHRDVWYQGFRYAASIPDSQLLIDLSKFVAAAAQ